MTSIKIWPLSLLICLALVAQNAIANQALPDSAPIPSDNPMSVEKVNLGRMLYFDPRLSLDNTVSCNTCHDATKSGTDNLKVSKGVAGKEGGRNSPTVWNSAFLSVQFWDGRAPTLEEQAKGPLVNPVEMAMENHGVVVERVAKLKGYRDQFDKVFGKNSVNIDNIAKAIAAYERTLITPNSPFDRHIKGEKSALSAAAKRGWQTFQSAGCIACHSGPMFAGPPMPTGTGFYQKFPLIPNEEIERKHGFTKDPGRYEVTKNEADRNTWRVPSLRNVEITAPYFHNGSVTTLEEAVKIMAKTQLNRELKPNEVSDIVAFLKSLTGKRPKERPPQLPKS